MEEQKQAATTAPVEPLVMLHFRCVGCKRTKTTENKGYDRIELCRQCGMPMALTKAEVKV